MLVGGGHSHVEVVRLFGERPEPGVRITLVARQPRTVYSGMLPGVVAGHYAPEDCQIDLVRLCERSGVRFLQGEAIGIDRTSKHLLLQDLPPLRYDILALDVGITPLLDDIPGAREHALFVKPIGDFLPKVERLLAEARTGAGPRRIAVVGGGAAGFELALALAHRLRGEAPAAGADPTGFSFTLISGGALLADGNSLVRRAARRALRTRNVLLVEHDPATEIHADAVLLDSGERIDAEVALLSTTAAAPDWLRGTGLQLAERGFVAIGRTLQSTNDSDIFASGDCATMIEDPRPKAGVFAVRQGPALAGNIRRRLQGRPLIPHYPQRRWLSLLSTGDRYAIAGRGILKLEGRWVWRWKDSIDRRWISRYAASGLG